MERLCIMSRLVEENAATQYNVLLLTFSRDTALVVGNLGLSEDKKKDVKSIIEALTQHVEDVVNETVERKAFRQRRQQSLESFDDFLVSLRDLVRSCNYCSDECVNKTIRDQIIEGILDGDTIEELLRNPILTLEKAADESAKQQRADIKGHVVNRASTSYGKQREQTSAVKNNAKAPAKNGGRCGRPWHKNVANCPAKDMTSLKCGKLGHFASHCKSNQANKNDPVNDKPINHISVDKPTLWKMSKSQSSDLKAPTVCDNVSGRNGSSKIRALLDSGAEVTAADALKILPFLGEDVENLLEPTHLETS